MSVIVNPLPVAYADEAEWDANPEIVRLTEIEVQRRRGTGHLTFMFAEQLLVAAAIGVYDNRPIDAWRRLAVGSITSLAFAWSTPTRTGAQLPTLHLRYDGKTLHAGLHREF